MRRTTVHKPLKRTDDSRRTGDEAEERPAGRPEVRRDIARTWWPES